MTSGMIVFIVSLAVLIGVPATVAKITGESLYFIISLYLIALAATIALLIACTFQMSIGS